LAPERVNCDVPLFWTTPVTPVLITALMATEPLPLPELVIVPILLTVVPEIVIPLLVELLFCRIRAPEVLATPPVRLKIAVPLALVRVVDVVFTVSCPLIVKADVVLFSMTCVTLAPTPPVAPIVVAPVLLPVLVTVPALLTAAVENVTASELLLFKIVKLLVPVTPPLKVRAATVPLLPIVKVPTLALVERTIGLAMVRPETLTKRLAALEPVVSPNVTVPVPLLPKAPATVPMAVPLLILNPPVKVLVWLSVAVPLKVLPPETPSVNPPVPVAQAPVWARLPLPVMVVE
jgi:hypothetical protein